jgi:hypothetical protein
MNKYIKCDEKFIDEAISVCNPSAIAAIRMKEFLQNYPASDVEEVIRCEDCKLYKDNKSALVRYCHRECKNLTVKPTDYCSYGKKKESN